MLRDSFTFFDLCVQLPDRYESEHLCMSAFGISRNILLKEFKTPLNQLFNIKKIYKSYRKYQYFLKLRNRNMPLAYILKSTDFMMHRYHIKPGVLIPRPETELLVETMINYIKKLSLQPTILELGFGSGVISIELGLAFPHLKIIACDISKKAYQLAKLNASELKVNNIFFINNDFFKSNEVKKILNSDDSIFFVSNPPYIPDIDIPTLMPDVLLYEPKAALKGGQGGLKFYRKIIRYFQEYTSIKMLFFEIGIDQSKPLAKLAHQFGWNRIEFLNDYQGIPRIMMIHL